MTDGPLVVLELRVFRPLLFRRGRYTLEGIRIELNGTPEPPAEELEAAPIALGEAAVSRSSAKGAGG